MHLLQGHYYSSHEGPSLISLDCDFPTAPSLCGGRIHHTECDRFQDQSPALAPASFSCCCCCCCYQNVPGSRALGQPVKSSILRFGKQSWIQSWTCRLFWIPCWYHAGPIPGSHWWAGMAWDVEATDERHLTMDGCALLHVHRIYCLCVVASWRVDAVHHF